MPAYSPLRFPPIPTHESAQFNYYAGYAILSIHTKSFNIGGGNEAAGYLDMIHTVLFHVFKSRFCIIISHFYYYIYDTALGI